MISKLNLNFHQTFKPEKHYIAAILEIAGNEINLSAKEISLLTGIPQGESSGKVEPHIIYASFMGLIEYEKKEGSISLRRTSLGEIVYMEDPGLQETLSILLCHGMMLRELHGAPLWYESIKKILPRYQNGIAKDMLLKELSLVFGDKINVKNLAPLYGSYDSFFEQLDIVNELNDSISVNSIPYDKEFIYVYAVVLLYYWEEKFPNQDEITSIQFEKLLFGKAFGWNMQSEYEVLEHLADKSIIRMNRQLMPYTILKLVNAEDLIDKLYSELC